MAHETPQLEDVWNAYVAGARSGQRHPKVSLDLLNRCADAYVKSRWTLAHQSGEMHSVTTRDLMAEAIRQTMLVVDAQHSAGVPVNLMTVDYPAIITAAREASK